MATEMPQLNDIQQQMQALMAATGNMQPPADLQQPQPDMAQAYFQMMQYLQQLQGAGGMGMGAMPGGMPGMPPMPFPGLPYAPPQSQEATVAVSVEGMKFQYQLTEDDLLKVFSRYGGVKGIRVEEGGSAATITFISSADAQAAINDLNGKVLNGLEGTLRLNWISGQNASPPFPTMPFPGVGFPPMGAVGWPPGAPVSASGAGSPPADSGKGDNNKGVRKYTCRFIIGIENDKEFQVARRVIGSKGAHMKRIVRQTEVTGSAAKLRLRGVGSGYFENGGQKESVEPLQLCISCTSSEGYKIAVRQSEELLKRVYDEYRQFCAEHGKPVPDLQINLSESQLVYGNSFKTSAAVAAADESPDPPDLSNLFPKKQMKKFKQQVKKSATATNGEMDRGAPGPNAPSIQEIEKLIDDRNEARRACNFMEADRIRQLLHSRGVALMDEPGGRGRGTEVTTWRYWRE